MVPRYIILVALNALLKWRDVSAHSWIACTNYDTERTSSASLYWDPAACFGYARCGDRQSSVEFGVDTGFEYQPHKTNLGTCQCALGTADAYSTRAPMAKYSPGQKVCLAYPSKNHVAASCTNAYIPDVGLRIYRSEHSPSSDAAVDGWSHEYPHLNGVHQNGVIDYKGYQNCPKFCENPDKSLCTVCFNLEETLIVGKTYTFNWQWRFNDEDDLYSSCWEALIVPKRDEKRSTDESFGTLRRGMAENVPHSSEVVFSTRDGRIVMNDREIRLKGLNWFGFEETNNIVHGLWGNALTFESVFEFMKKHGFNVIRLPFSVSTVLSNPIVKCGDIQGEPLLTQKDSYYMLEVMEMLIDEAAKHGILILLDNHRLRPENGISELWYDETTTIKDVKLAWKQLSGLFCAKWNVMGADLKNEPHGAAEWGTGSPKDWRLGAEDLGNHVLAECPRWLIFVEGVEKNIKGDFSSENGWWGGKMQGVHENPVRLKDPSKLVYSPHVYGPSVFHKPSFSNPSFPLNMSKIWKRDFGFLVERKTNPVVVGEWGGFMKDLDAKWHREIFAYFDMNDIDTFYWSLNPNSGDTGGLLENDWKTPVYRKLQLLSNAKHTDIRSALDLD